MSQISAVEEQGRSVTERAPGLARSPVSGRARASGRRGRSGPSLGEFLFVLPIVVVVGVTIVLPTASVVLHSFTAWAPGYDSPWVGVDNYRGLFESEAFRTILKNHAYLLLGLPLWTALPLVLAYVLHERVPAAGTFRTVFFFPSIVSPAIIGILFGFLLSPDGPLDRTLALVGLPAPGWLSEPGVARVTIVLVLAWATLGTGVMIFATTLATVPGELFEAAELDGAGWWARLRHVVVPSLRHVIGLWIVLLVLTTFVAVFPWIFTLTRGGPGYATTTLDFDIYQNALQFGYFGAAAAEAVLLLLIVGAIVLGGAVLGRRLAKS